MVVYQCGSVRVVFDRLLNNYYLLFIILKIYYLLFIITISHYLIFSLLQKPKTKKPKNHKTTLMKQRPSSLALAKCLVTQTTQKEARVQMAFKQIAKKNCTKYVLMLAEAVRERDDVNPPSADERITVRQPRKDNPYRSSHSPSPKSYAQYQLYVSSLKKKLAV